MAYTSHSSPVQVVYIMGYGRSGSTLLDTILGNHPDIVGVGELWRSFRDYRLEKANCSCGQRGRDCLFWGAVVEHWLAHPDMRDLEMYTKLQDLFECRTCLPRLIRERFHPSANFQRYVLQTQALFEAISVVSGKRIVVDSSKNPIRGLVLSMLPGIDLRIIHLIRDGRGVAWSLKKPRPADAVNDKPLPVSRTAAMWTLINLLSALVRQRFAQERTMLCRYEDLVLYPSQTLTCIGNFVGCDFAPIIDHILSERPLAVSHIVAGNALRKAGSIRLRLDTDWRERLSPGERLLFYSMAGWLMKRYGYSGTVISSSS